MHARVTTSLAHPGKLDDILSIAEDSIVPTAKQQKGFKGYLGLTDWNLGKSITITLWESEADMRAGEASGYYQQQIAQVEPLMAGPPTVEHYEVVIQE